MFATNGRYRNGVSKMEQGALSREYYRFSAHLVTLRLSCIRGSAMVFPAAYRPIAGDPINRGRDLRFSGAA